jgi:hypothetical protein
VDKSAKEASGYAAFGWKKTVWAFNLIANQRGIRWNHQIKNVPAQSPKSKAKFLFDQLYRFFQCMLYADLLFELTRRLSFTTPDGKVGALNSKHLTMRDADWRWSFVKTFIFGATPYWMLSMQYAQFAFISVLAGLSKPEDWPNPFGSLAFTGTLRDFWGKFWHQQLRHVRRLHHYNSSVQNALSENR